MTNRRIGTAVAVAGIAAVLAPAVLAGPAAAQGAPAGNTAGKAGISLPAGFSATVFAPSGSAGVTGPDDIALLDGDVFVGYQNGVGSKGEPSPTGKTQSTVVEYTRDGREVGHWDVTGKVDGLGADPSRGRVIATVNEDGNSSLYTITPGEHGHGSVVRHYHYSPSPLAHGGGTDSVVVRHGVIFITASAPAPGADGTTFSGPSLFTARLAGGTATVTPVLMDNSTATDAVTGKTVTLNLSDPDSSAVVPRSVPRFGGDVLLDSQGDGELIFLSHPGRRDQHNTVLPLAGGAQVDDSTFATDPHGTLFVVDSANNDVLAIRGSFRTGEAFASVPSGSPTRTGLDRLDLVTGAVTPFATGIGSPKGLLFVSSCND